MHRHVASLSGLALCAVLAGCTSGPGPEASARAHSAQPSPMQSSFGIVTGYIDPCWGVPPETPEPYYAGTVIAVQGANAVASDTVATGGAYRFYLVPGHYRLVAQNTVDQNSRWVDVTVVAGGTGRHDIPNTCK